jgi:pyrimidine oxygenase
MVFDDDFAGMTIMSYHEPTPFGLPSDIGGKDLGVFMPMANGGWILSRNKPPLDGSYAYNRQVAVLAEVAGLDFVMAMAKYRGMVATPGTGKARSIPWC